MELEMQFHSEHERHPRGWKIRSSCVPVADGMHSCNDLGRRLQDSLQRWGRGDTVVLSDGRHCNLSSLYLELAPSE